MEGYSRDTYHVSLEVFLLLALEPLEIPQNACTSILYVIMRYFNGLFQLQKKYSLVLVLEKKVMH